MVDEITRTQPDDSVRVFKAGLAALRRRKRFVPYRASGAFAEELRSLIAHLDDHVDPRTGVELMAAFYWADAAVFELCDDSDGMVGDVFRFDARDRFVHYAVQCDDKNWLAGLVFDLLESDDYGVRDSVLDDAARYLPELTLRSLADREWKAAEATIPQASPVRDYARDYRLILVEVIARQLNDPRLFERARRAHVPELGTAACTEIARAWLSAGDPVVALQWLARIDARETFMAHERDELLGTIYRQLGRRDELEQLVWKRFRASWSRETLDQLLTVIGAEHRANVVAEATAAILHTIPFVAGSAAFLLECGRAEDAADYIVMRRVHVDGDYWSGLLPLARGLEEAGQPLAATVVYRALLDSILARAQTRTYGHGARYLRRLGELSHAVADWKGVSPHGEYAASLREHHARKTSFWKLVPG